MANWNETSDLWGGVALGSKQFAPVYCASTSFYIFGYDSSTALDTRAERKALIHERGYSLLGTYVWPVIIGASDGDTIQVSLGGSETPEGAIDWEGPYDFEIGADTFVDFAVDGRYLSVKFESTDVIAWTLQSYDVDYEFTGKY